MAEAPAITYFTAFATYFSYGLLFAFGRFRDLFRKVLDRWSSSNLQGYAPICLGLGDFYFLRFLSPYSDGCCDSCFSSHPCTFCKEQAYACLPHIPRTFLSLGGLMFSFILLIYLPLCWNYMSLFVKHYNRSAELGTDFNNKLKDGT